MLSQLALPTRPLYSSSLFFCAAIVLIVAFATSTVFAAEMTLNAAKTQGVVGEQADGYLAPVQSSAPANVQALIRDVNAKRRAEYQRIAKANNITLADVQSLAGRKAIQRTAPGNFIRQDDGSWRRK